jgi:hypothetical protein
VRDVDLALMTGRREIAARGAEAAPETVPRHGERRRPCPGNRCL